MARLGLPGSWETKPPPGVRIDWGHPLAQGLVAYFPLNEQVGQPRDLVSGLQTTANSTPTWTPRGGGGRDYDGGDNGTRSDSTEAIPSGLWLVNSTKGFTAASRVVASANGGDFDSYGFMVRNVTGNALLMSMQGDGNGRLGLWVAGGQRLGTPNAIQSGFAGTCFAGADAQGHFIYQYADGGIGLVNSGTNATALTTITPGATNQIRIGNDNGNARNFRGVIREVALWDRRLAQHERELYHLDPYCFLVPA